MGFTNGDAYPDFYIGIVGQDAANLTINNLIP